MAGTDDLEKELAEILLNETARATAFAGEKIALLAEDAASGASRGVAIAQKRYRDRMDKERLNHMTGRVSVAELNQIMENLQKKTVSMRVSDADAKEYETLLRKKDILYARIDTDASDDFTTFLALDRDQKVLTDVLNILQARRGAVTEVPPEMFLESLASERIGTMTGLDEVELALLREEARQRGLLFATIGKPGKHTILYNEADEGKVRDILLNVGWMLTSADGARIREHVENRVRGISMIRGAAEAYTQDLIVASRINPRNHIEITADSFAIYKNGEMIKSVNRMNPEFNDECVRACLSLSRPVIMLPQEYRPDLVSNDLDEIPDLDLYPRDFEEMREQEILNRLRDLISRKYALDNEHNATWGLTDPSVSYSEFAGYEEIADRDEREGREREVEHFRSAAFYGAGRLVCERYENNDRNLDIIIQKAEAEKEKAMEQPARSREAKGREV